MSYQTELRSFQCLKQPATNLTTGQSTYVSYPQIETLIIPKTDANGVGVGTAFELPQSGCNLIVTGYPKHGETVFIYPVTTFHQFAELHRNVFGAKDRLGRSEPEPQLVQAAIPVIISEMEKCLLSPEIDIQHGDILLVKECTFLVTGVQYLSGRLQQLVVSEQR